MKRFFVGFFLLFVILYVQADPFYYFIPPQKWNLVPSDKLAQGAVVAFVEKSQKPFKASINLGIESISMPLEKYVAIAKRKIEADRSNTWTSLGYIKTVTSTGHLAQIDSKKGCGDVRSYQCIFSSFGKIFVLTGVCLKEDHQVSSSLFMQAFESFAIYENGLASLDPQQQKTLSAQRSDLHKSWLSFTKNAPSEALFSSKEFQKKHWRPFEKKLQSAYKSLGLFWQAQTALESKQLLLSQLKSLSPKD